MAETIQRTHSQSLEIGKPAKLDTEMVLREYKSRMQEAKRHTSKWRKEARDLNELRAEGQQMDDADKQELEQKYGGAYPLIAFNLTDKYCSAVEGLQINNRQQIRYYPRELGDAGIDEYSTSTVEWCRYMSEAEDEESDMFSDVFLVGAGCMEHFLEDIEDPESPYIAQQRRDILEMYWDANARRKNLVDRRWQVRLKPFAEDEFKEQWGDEPWGWSEEPPEIQSQRVTRPDDYDKGDDNDAAAPQPIYVADYQFSRNVTHYLVTATFPEDAQAAAASGEQAQPKTQLFSLDEWLVVKAALIEQRIDYDIDRVTKRVYYRAWICKDKILGKIRALPCGFTYEFITGKRDRNKNLWYGMGRVIRDPQLWVNKFFASILYTIAVNSKGGLMAEEDAFEDPAEAERSYANPSSITWTAPGAIAQGKIREKQQVAYPAALGALMEFTLNLMPLTSGMNPELLGLADRDQPGVLEAQRKQAALSIIAWVFDAMRRYFKRSGRMMLSMISEYMTEGQLIRINNSDGKQQYVPLMKDKLVAKYDVIADEAPTSVNMQERVFLALKEMVPLAASMGVPIPKEIIDYMPLPSDLKATWKKSMEPSPEKQQQQQKAQQLQEAGAQALVAKDQTQAQLNAAKAQQITGEAQLDAQAAPSANALTQAQAVKTAAEAGLAQAGGS